MSPNLINATQNCDSHFIYNKQTKTETNANITLSLLLSLSRSLSLSRCRLLRLYSSSESESELDESLLPRPRLSFFSATSISTSLPSSCFGRSCPAISNIFSCNEVTGGFLGFGNISRVSFSSAPGSLESSSMKRIFFCFLSGITLGILLGLFQEAKKMYY